MQLKDYQEIAIDDLLAKAKKLLAVSGSKKLVFKAPTGSGKTIMMAEFLKRLVNDREVKKPLGFIWTAPRQLHTQSKKKLESYLEKSRALECLFFNELNDSKIGENEVLFFNWESVNKKDKNTIVKENEQEFYLSKVLENTQEDGREIILVIDEAHHHATSDISQSLIKLISPKLTIEVSATPVLEGDLRTDIMIESVKNEAMIKKSLIINDGLGNKIKNGKIETDIGNIKNTEEVVIELAMKKREKLIKAFANEKVEINPLVLIQLPDRIGELEDRMKERVISILKNKHNITTEKGNNKLAIWLSGEHVNKEDIERNDSGVEVLIFKQAIALGWDCPRAHIIVLFREWSSPVFSVQTVGRIMRMPDPENQEQYYKNDILNYAYVYTNLTDIEIQEEIGRNYVTIYTSERRKDYKNIDLLSCHSKRQREKTRLSPLFNEIFLDEAKKYDLAKKIDRKSKSVGLKMISDYKTSDVDTLAGAHIVGDKAIKIGEGDLQKIYDYFMRKLLQGGEVSIYPEDRSVGRLKEGAINQFFKNELRMNYLSEQWEEVIKIVLNDENSEHFRNVIEKAKKIYKEEVEKRDDELAIDENWNPRPFIPYEGAENDFIKEDYKKSLMQPFYKKGDGWKSEKFFIDYLEKSKNVDWWFKNGSQDAVSFAVPYKEQEKSLPFYVDFVIKTKNGRIWLLDPHGTYLTDFGPKSSGLQEYIKKNKKLFGGIVANTDERDYQGQWVIFTEKSGEFKRGDFKSWQNLNL